MLPKVRDKIDKAIDAMDVDALRNFVNYVAEVLYFDHDAERWDLNKECDNDTLDKIINLFPATIREAVEIETRDVTESARCEQCPSRHFVSQPHDNPEGG